jgi:hypothetical protein
MTDQPGATKDGVCRWSLLKSVPMIAGAIISATTIPDSIFAKTKLSHEASQYAGPTKGRAAMLGLRSIRATVCLQDCRESNQSKRLVPALRRQAGVTPPSVAQ